MGTVSTIQGLVHRQENMNAPSIPEASKSSFLASLEKCVNGNRLSIIRMRRLPGRSNGHYFNPDEFVSTSLPCEIRTPFPAVIASFTFLAELDVSAMYRPNRLLCRSICLSIAGWLSAPYSWASAKYFAYLAEMDFTINAFQ